MYSWVRDNKQKMHKKEKRKKCPIVFSLSPL